ncbi:hypothetical protein R3W88_000494 [Solanum pinnatisectum]|uniref:Translocon at the inner envelope membrane of chloroplasts 214 n=1 Tax=Solanum pinnatisectum TaxID=50273 RepID=A0AAV9MJ82_9SOLN|nr:hypothetical protein R3W88_000494 [Solanum pinnatisectum]
MESYYFWKYILKKKRKIMRRLKGIQKSLNYTHNFFLTQLENELIQEYNYLLRVEEKFWRLKSRVNWLNEGDANTRFFHTTNLNRRRKNRIIALITDEREWLFNQNDIKNTTFNYFKNLFHTSQFLSKGNSESLEDQDIPRDLSTL